MSYFTEPQLRSYKREPVMESRSANNLKRFESLAQISIFLSHSHNDKDLVEGVVRYFGALGLSVYVDWKDTSMPPTTNVETADRIKARIRKDDLFIFLATKNGCHSKWCPWELGIADDHKRRENILVLPVADPSGRFHGNEYLQLYPHLEFPDTGGEKIAGVFVDKLAVFSPGALYGGQLVDSYFSARSRAM